MGASSAESFVDYNWEQFSDLVEQITASCLWAQTTLQLGSYYLQ